MPSKHLPLIVDVNVVTATRAAQVKQFFRLHLLKETDAAEETPLSQEAVVTKSKPIKTQVTMLWKYKESQRKPLQQASTFREY